MWYSIYSGFGSKGVETSLCWGLNASQTSQWDGNWLTITLIFHRESCRVCRFPWISITTAKVPPASIWQTAAGADGWKDDEPASCHNRDGVGLDKVGQLRCLFRTIWLGLEFDSILRTKGWGLWSLIYRNRWSMGFILFLLKYVKQNQLCYRIERQKAFTEIFTCWSNLKILKLIQRSSLKCHIYGTPKNQPLPSSKHFNHNIYLVIPPPKSITFV